MNRRAILASLFISLCFSFCFCGTARSQTRPTSTATVVGAVMDQQGSIILLPKPIVLLEGETGVTEATVDEQGQFRVVLPVGTYNITTRIPSFYPFHRAKFNVIAGKTIMINVAPSLRILVRGTSVSSKDLPDTVAPPPKFDEIQVLPKPGLSGVIQFVTKRIVDGEATYTDAVFSYDNLTIYAETLRLNQKPFRLMASGARVVFEDGNERKEVGGVVIQAKEGRLIVDVTAQVHP